jgi:hypothetical protein
MTSSSSLVPPAPARSAPRLTWTFKPAGRPGGLALAREKGFFFTWDDKDWLYLLDRAGQRQAQVRAPAPVGAGAVADDGSAYAVAGREGGVWWLAPDLMPRWQHGAKHAGVAVALDPLGQMLAVSVTRGRLYCYDRLGRPLARVETPRPLHHMAFVPEAPYLVASADFGLVACYDPEGQCAWRDGLVAHVGSLAVTADGSRIILACYTDGLRSYDLAGRKLAGLAQTEPWRLAAVTIDGQRLLGASLRNDVHELDPQGQIRRTVTFESPVVALALGALGRDGAVALADGRIIGLDLRE